MKKLLKRHNKKLKKTGVKNGFVNDLNTFDVKYGKNR